MMELEIVTENSKKRKEKNTLSSQFKEHDLGVDKLLKEEKIT